MTQKILWRGKTKEDAELNLERHYKPADPDAFIEKDGDTWVVKAKAHVVKVKEAREK